MFVSFGDEQLTLWEVAARMHWHRAWHEIRWMGKGLALSEAAAHLRHLVARGPVVEQQGVGVALFRRARDARPDGALLAATRP
ncbi:hypothetical protein TSOC111612_06800 [Tsukamurella ocularis]